MFKMVDVMMTEPSPVDALSVAIKNGSRHGASRGNLGLLPTCLVVRRLQRVLLRWPPPRPRLERVHVRRKSSGCPRPSSYLLATMCHGKESLCAPAILLIHPTRGLVQVQVLQTVCHHQFAYPLGTAVVCLSSQATRGAPAFTRGATPRGPDAICFGNAIPPHALHLATGLICLEITITLCNTPAATQAPNGLSQNCYGRFWPSHPS